MAAAALVGAAALFAIFGGNREKLILSDSDTGKVYAEFPVEDGDRFSVTYIHSVHQTPVTEAYEVRDGEIYVVEARFYTFGAGMQTDYGEGVTYTYADNGEIIASGYNTLCTGMVYCVGKVSDHTLELNGEEYSLRELCGRGSLVAFNIQ